MILFVLIGTCFSIAIGLTQYLDQIRPPLPKNYLDDDLALQAGRFKGFVFGAEGLFADWYWINSLQYIGGKISNVGLDRLNLDDLSALNPRLLYPYLNNAVEMDPKFLAAYSYGATVLPAIDVDQAIALTEKGIANNPENWRLYHYLGYIHWRRKNFEKAAEVYTAGSQIPGAAPFMREMAASMRSSGGSRETAREMYLQLAAESQDQQTKDNAELRILEIDSLDDREVLNEQLKIAKERSGTCPAKLSDIIPFIQNMNLPRNRSFSVNQRNELVDPTGIPYQINEKACTADLAVESRIPRRSE